MCRAGKPFPCNKMLREVRGYKGNKTQTSQQAILCNILLPVTGLCNARFTKFKCRPVRSSGSRMLWTQPALKRGGTDTGYHSSGPQGPRGLISSCAALNRAPWAQATCKRHHTIPETSPMRHHQASRTIQVLSAFPQDQRMQGFQHESHPPSESNSLL